MKKLISISLLLLIGFFSGCKKNFLELSNPNQLTSDSYYKTESEAVGAVNSVYAVLQHMNLFKQIQWLVYDGMSDDVGWAGNDDESVNAMLKFTFTPTSAKSNEVWRTLYTGVFRANTVITNVNNMPDFALKNRVLGEAKFLRAWFYFELVTGWGAVPKITEPLDGAQKNYNFPRADKQEIYNLIYEDLQFAEQYLPMKSDYAVSELGRATSGAASAYLGKVFLFQKMWPKAIEQFKKVINSNQYKLTDKYADNFSAATENNTESVFEIQFSGDGAGIWTAADVPGAGEGCFLAVMYFNWGTVGPMFDFKRNQLFGLPGAGRGPRYKATFGVNGQGAARIKKYVEFNTSEPLRSDVNIRDMRYADVLMMYAEALNELNQPGEAKEAINQVIDRVRKESGLANRSVFTGAKELQTVDQLLGNPGNSGFPLFLSDNQNGIRNLVKYQRRIEFMYEQKRYKDLVRWGDAADALVKEDDDGNVTQLFIKGKHELFPIPDTEISGNEGISPSDQNPGY